MSKLNVLNIDDSETNLMLSELVLCKTCEKAQVTNCDGYASALEEYNKLDGDVSLIVCDYHMPEVDGKEVLKRFREMGYEGKFYILTADAFVGISDFPSSDGVILKPMVKTALDNMVVNSMCPLCEEEPHCIQQTA
jgi:CheY-like chemotaxis protein